MDDKFIVHRQIHGESGWETNPPRPATRPATGFEDQEAHRDLTTPINKDNRMKEDWQASLEKANEIMPECLYKVCKIWKQQNARAEER